MEYLEIWWLQKSYCNQKGQSDFASWVKIRVYRPSDSLCCYTSPSREKQVRASTSREQIQAKRDEKDWNWTVWLGSVSWTIATTKRVLELRQDVMIAIAF